MSSTLFALCVLLSLQSVSFCRSEPKINNARKIKRLLDKSETEIKRYVDSSLTKVRHDILNALSDSMASCSQNNKQTAEVLDKLTELETKYTCFIKSNTSCLDLYQNGEHQSGVYDIYPLPCRQPVRVYCDMDTDGGGWTVFQRRQDGSEDFYRTWTEYASGFGDVEGEFWLGNSLLSSLTTDCCHELRVDMGDFGGDSAYAKYSTFRVLLRKDTFALKIGGYTGNASDSLGLHADMAFSTHDRDNDEYTGGQCAQEWSGGWWYKHCHYASLNGLYGRDQDRSGVVWYHWTSSWAGLKWTEMKFRAN